MIRFALDWASVNFQGEKREFGCKMQSCTRTPAFPLENSAYYLVTRWLTPRNRGLGGWGRWLRGKDKYVLFRHRQRCPVGSRRRAGDLLVSSAVSVDRRARFGRVTYCVRRQILRYSQAVLARL